MENENLPSHYSTRFSVLVRLSRFCNQLLRSLMRPAPIAPIAVLIDGDNISSDLIAPILAEAGKFGGVTIRRVYGNWAVSSMHGWQQIAGHYGLEQRHHEQVALGKNAADIALVIDAMDLLYRGDVNHFCLATSDSDYTPLVRRLRAAGCIVIGIGKPPTPSSLRQACTFFISTEQLFPSSSSTKKVLTTQNEAAPDTMPPTASDTSLVSTQSLPTGADPDLVALLTKAYTQEAKEKTNEWIAIPLLSSSLKKLSSTFKAKDYGKKDLPTLIQSYPQVFETRKQTQGKARHVEVRLRQ